MGASTWEGSGGALTVWADDPVTATIDGLRDGEPVSIVVWDKSADVVRSASDVSPTFDPAFAPRDGFTPDGLYLVASTGATDKAAPPEAVTLGDAYPNPVVQRAQIPFSLAAEADVSVEVFDALGRRVAVPFEGHLWAGDHTVPFEASGLANGVYHYRLRAGDTVMQGRLTVSR